MLRQLMVVLMIVGTTVFAASADAHPRIRTADPVQGGVLARSPTEIRMTFSEALLPQFSGLKLMDVQGRVVATGKAMRTIRDKGQFVVPLTVRLPAGTYRVSWYAVYVIRCCGGAAAASLQP